MNPLYRWHDDYLLRFVQDWYFGGAGLSGLVVVALLLGLPVHRRSAQVIIGCLAGWVLLTVVLYGAFNEAPALACATVLAAVYSLLRGVTWLHRVRAEDGVQPPAWAWLHPRGTWVAAVIRDYFSVDPRGAYWLDAASASRGRIPRRTAVERERALPTPFELPQWRVRLWRRVVFPVVEMHIRCRPRLPRYWHYDHDDLDLRELHVQAVLREEIARAARLTALHEAGESFAEYRHRTVDAVLNARSLQLAGRYGRKFCLLTEAWVESRLFGGQFAPGDKRLCEIADTLIDLWRFRRRNDWLWVAECFPEQLAQQAAVDPAHARSSATAEALPTGEEYAADPQDEPSGNGHAAESQTPDYGDELLPADDDWQLESERADSEPLDAEDSDEPAAPSHPESESHISEDIASAAQQSAEIMPPADEPSGLGSERAAALGALSPRDEECVRDLRTACQLLEAFLDFEPSDDLAITAQAAQRLLDRPAQWPAVTRLLMLYCLRADLRSERQERAKTEIVARTFQWVRSLLGQDELVKSVKQAFFDLLIDWHTLRGGYSQIRELFSQTEPRTARQWELLGLSEAQIASQVKDRPSLRNALIRDAVAALFRARVSGFWTQRYAGLLLGTSHPVETIRLLQDHEVEFGRSELDRLLDQSRAATPAVEEPPAAALEVEPPTDSPPAWFQRHKSGATPSAEVSGSHGQREPAPTAPERSRSPVPEQPAAVSPLAAPASLPTLILVDLSSGRRLTCRKYPLRFGSDAQNQIQHSKLNGKHCAITCDQGRVSLVPLVEGAMVQVNDKIVKQPVRLKTGDKLKLGPISFQVESI